MKYQGNLTTQVFKLSVFSIPRLETNIESIPPKHTTRSSQSKPASLKSLEIFRKPSIRSGKLWSEIKKAVKVTETERNLGIEKVIKETSIRDRNPEKENKVDQPKHGEAPLPSTSKLTSSPLPKNQAIDPDKGKQTLTQPKKPKHKIEILAKKIGKLKQNIEASEKHVEESQKHLEPLFQLTKEASDIEVVELSSDSELDDEEFRKIFAQCDTNIDFDISDTSDEELLSSDDTSDTTSSCILLDTDEPIPGPSSTTRSELIIPELPTSTTISRIRSTNVPTKPMSKNVKKSRNINKEIEVVDLE